MKVFGEAPPDAPRIGLDVAAVEPRHAHRLRRNALTVKHAMHVMVGHNEQPRRIRKGQVVGEPLRIGVTVRADDRQLFDRFK